MNSFTKFNTNTTCCHNVFRYVLYFFFVWHALQWNWVNYFQLTDERFIAAYSKLCRTAYVYGWVDSSKWNSFTESLTRRPFSTFFLILYLSFYESFVLIYQKLRTERLVVIIMKVSFWTSLYNVLNIHFQVEASFYQTNLRTKMVEISSIMWNMRWCQILLSFH